VTSIEKLSPTKRVPQLAPDPGVEPLKVLFPGQGVAWAGAKAKTAGTLAASATAASSEHRLEDMKNEDETMMCGTLSLCAAG
jgi:hypothetical protein